MNPKDYIQHLYTLRSDFKHESQAFSIAQLLNVVSSDIYTESQRFFYELIQNADDSCSFEGNHVYIDFLDNTLIVSHNGDKFTEEDIDSISNAGASTKRGRKATTGYKGIGFKSVFGRSERVTVLSGEYQFRFDKKMSREGYPWQTIPIWTEHDELPQEVQDLIFACDRPVITIMEMQETDLLKDLLELLGDGQILLFLRRVHSIIISTNGKTVARFDKKILETNAAYTHVALEKDGTSISTWLVQTFSEISVPEEVSDEIANDMKVPEKLRDANETEITFAACLLKENIAAPKQSLIYTFLPTRVTEFGFPFLVNGNFLTNASREAIHQDNRWNIWLFEIVARKNFEWLSQLAFSKYKFQVLKLLPKPFTNTNSRLMLEYNKGFRNVSTEFPFLTVSSGEVRKAAEVLHDKTKLSEQNFIEKQAILQYYEDVAGEKLDEDCFLHKDLVEKHRLESIAVKELTTENFFDFFRSKRFSESHQLEQNLELIKFLKAQSDLDIEGIIFTGLKKLPFIFDAEGILRNPVDGVCFPSGDGSQKFEMGTVPVIAETIYHKIRQDQELYKWLTTLGTQQPSEKTYITNVILPNLGDDKYVNEGNYLKLTNYLARMYHIGNLDSEILGCLRELRLKTKGDTIIFKQAQKCYLSSVYVPRRDLEGVIDLDYVSTDYLDNGLSSHEWGTFFRAISVKDEITIDTITTNTQLASIAQITGVDWVNYAVTQGEAAALRVNGFGFGSWNKLLGVKVPSFLSQTAKNYEYSKIFWKHMFDNSGAAEQLRQKVSFRYGKGYGENSYSKEVDNYLPWFVNNHECIPSLLGTLHKSDEVYLPEKEIKLIAGDFLPVLNYDDGLTTSWRSYFNFRKRLEIEDYLSILDSLSTKSDALSKKEIKTIGLIYNKLSSLLVDMASDDKEKIAIWASNSKLLSYAKVFEPIHELKKIEIEGFSHDGGLKLIFLPTNVDLVSINPLLELFGIQIIREFVPQFQELEIDSSLSSRLEEILPSLAIVAQSKSFEDGVDEFGRMYGLLDQITINVASLIQLSFYQSEEIHLGPVVKVFRDNASFTYQKNWRSERVLLDLVSELTDFLKFPGSKEELRFLLMETDRDEIEAWLNEMGMLISDLPQVVRFSKKVTNNIEDYKGYENQAHFINEPEPSLSSTTKEEFVLRHDSRNFDFSNIPISNFTRTEDTTSSTTEYASMEDEDLRKAHGRWAEQFVDGYLKETYPGAEIKWMNENGESFEPYDFSMLIEGVTRYLDVKGTPSPDKNEVDLSPTEWRFMMAKGESYSLYRVYNTNSNRVKLTVIENPAAKIGSGEYIPKGTILLI